MNWLDLIILLCIGVAVIKGLYDGFIKQVISLAALALGILFAGGVAILLQPIAEGFGFIPSYLTYPVCYVFSFTIILIVMGILGKALKKIWELTPFGFLNNIAGGATGGVLVLFLLSLFFNFLLIFDPDSRLIGEQSKRESVLYEKVRVVVPVLYPFIRDKVKDNFESSRTGNTYQVCNE